MKQLLFVYAIFFSFANGTQPKGVFILVHGTWGTKSEWYQPDGSFFKAIEDSAKKNNYTVVPFMWSGSLDHSSRMLAGAILAKLVQSYPAYMQINIVGHSHGGNVAIIASHILNADPDNKHAISALFTLGTPINTRDYMPNMNVIKKIYNFFSFEDKVQPIFGFFDREFPKHNAITNVRIFIENFEPGHGELTSELIGHWIPFIHEDLADKKIGNFEMFNFNYPGIIYFYNKQELKYCIESSRPQSLAIDKYTTHLLMHAVAKRVRLKRKKASVS